MAKTSNYSRTHNFPGKRPRCRSRKKVPVENLFRDLEHNIAALATSRRYRIGNSLGRIPGLFLFRPKPRLSMDHMQEIFREYNSARSGNGSIPPECLAGWIKDLKDIFESFLASSRWKVGTSLVGAADFYRSSGKEIPTVAYVRELFQDYDRGLYFVPGLKPDRLVFKGDPESESIHLPGKGSSEPVPSFTVEALYEEAPPASVIGFRWIKACPDLSGRDVCVFAAYEPDGILPEFKKSYLAALKRAGFVIVLVVALDDLNVKVVTGGLDFVDAILARDNKGFDFAAWSSVMSFVPSVWRTKLLILANDSVFGPSESFGRLIREIRDSDADLIGLTESYEYEPHLQSYFLALKGKALASPALQKYWSEIKAFRDKWDVIHNYETRFTSFCRGIGLKCRALFPYASICPDPGGEYFNPLHVKWRELIENGFPFIKVDLLRDIPVFADLDNWEQALRENAFEERLVRYGIPEAFRRGLDAKSTLLDGFHSAGQVRKAGKGNYQWASLSDRPAFFLDIDKLPAGVPGWRAFSLIMETSLPGGEASLHFFSGKGNENDEALFLPFENNKPVTRITCLDQPLKALRFVPVRQKCRFTIKHIGVACLEERQAEARLLDALIVSGKYRSIPGRTDLAKLLRDMADAENLSFKNVLLREYDSLFAAEHSLSYHEWIEKAERIENPDLQFLHSENPGFLIKPLISIIMTAGNAPENYLRQAVESVLRQSYSRWELCVSCEKSSGPQVRRILNEYEEKDSRIKVIYYDSSEGGAVAGNRALALATGEYVAFLDPCDRLPYQAFYRVAREINETPEAMLIYSDEDKMDQNGTRYDPVFKPGWNPDLFFSKNYISNSAFIRKSLVEKASGFRPGYEGCRIYDLLLRCFPLISGAQVVHIPRILYHCRSRKVCGSSENPVKPDASSAGLKALRDYFHLRSPAGIMVEPGPKPEINRVKYPLPDPPALVSLVIPTRDRLDLIKNCVESIIEKTSYKDYEILIIDNQSREKETLKWFKKIQEECPSVRIINYDRPFNFSALCNLGVEKAGGGIIGLVNNDIEVVNSEWLSEMVSQVSRPEIGCVGAKLYYPDGTLQHVGVVTGNSDEGVPWHIHFGEPGDFHGHSDRVLTVGNYSAVTAAVMLVRKAVYLEVGGFDDMNLAVAVNDVDFCLRLIEAGYRNLWTPYAELIHHESSSRGYEITPEQKQRYAGEIEFLKERFGEITNLDPLCNVNLRKCGSNLSLTVPGKQGN